MNEIIILIRIITESDKLTIEDMLKDPIILKSDIETKELNEAIIHKYVISLLENKFLELGTGFALVGHEYKIIIDNKTYHIDLLFYNYLLNAFVVIEVKTRSLKPQDIGQLEFYVGYVENNIKKNYHQKTIGVLIVKKNNKYIIEYITNSDIYVTTYLLK